MCYVHSKQFSVSLRWVDYNYVVYEDVIAFGLAEMHQIDTATLTGTLKNALIRCGTQLFLCWEQACDEASNM